MDAKRERFGAEDLATLFGDARRVVVVRQKKVLTFERGPGGAWPDELGGAVIGPSGNLRAPALRRGSTWLVGFDEGTYAAELEG